jgi:schlafen family protein
LNRAYFECSITELGLRSDEQILGALARNHGHALELLQRDAWIAQISHLRKALAGLRAGHLFIEFTIPRMGKRADVVILYGERVMVIEYKVGATTYERHAIDQVVDYALDLKNFHEGSHGRPIIPILVATAAPTEATSLKWGEDQVADPILTNAAGLAGLLQTLSSGLPPGIDPTAWLNSRYKPTPTIVEAARALYEGHRVEDISRSDAGAINLSRTANRIAAIIDSAKTTGDKAICFVTGVPGSGKTLAGLNLATQRMRTADDEHAVFLSGNGPLVSVLREALARDEVDRAKEEGRRVTKKAAAQKANAFIQNIHHFRDECLTTEEAPIEKVVVFDEAQRAWDKKRASQFMRERKGVPEFDMSEPEFLLSAMDRHPDWCVVVCLVGNGQEINTGEAGITEWLDSLRDHFPRWKVFYSPRFDEEAPDQRDQSELPPEAKKDPDLHLGVSVRSFRAERVAEFVSAILLGDSEQAREVHRSLGEYPIALTRDLTLGRDWLRSMARGSERYGLVASSNALRLKPLGLHMKSKIDAPNWFLGDAVDVRSSMALEDAASEFEVQGLELDWVGVCWDANLRYVDGEWRHFRFSGSTWMSVHLEHRQRYLTNAYRVLLTRARQGLGIVVPEGSGVDGTRNPDYYDGTYAFLEGCGLKPIN